MKHFSFLTIFILVTTACCSGVAAFEPAPGVTALVIDGFCVKNRSARAPAGYYRTDGGKAQLQNFLKKSDDEMPILYVSAAVMAQIREIAVSSDNQVPSGKVNFFIRFFDDKGPQGSRALSRGTLKQIINTLPQPVRAGLSGMYEHG